MASPSLKLIINPTSVVQGYKLAISKIEDPNVLPTKVGLCDCMTEVLGVEVSAERYDGWGNVYSVILEMRNYIWELWLLRVFGVADKKMIAGDRMMPTPVFVNELDSLTDTDTIMFSTGAGEFVDEMAKGYIKYCKENQEELIDMGNERAIQLIDRLKRVACLWSHHLEEMEEKYGYLYLQSRFGKRAGYFKPTHWQILNQRKKWFDWEGTRVINHIVQYFSLGGVSARQLTDDRTPYDAIGYHELAKLTLVDGPITDDTKGTFECPYPKCGASFEYRHDLLVHLESRHGGAKI